MIANRPNSAAVKYTYGPRIRAIFDQWYGLVHNTEQRAAAIVTTERLFLGQVTAVGWDSDRPVIWQISRSPRANVASTTAG